MITQKEIDVFENLRHDIIDRHGFDVKTNSRKTEIVSLKVAYCHFVKQVTKGKITYEQLGNLIGRDRSTITHYFKTMIPQLDLSKGSLFTQYYYEWMQKILALHPLISLKSKIQCRALLGYL